MVLAHASAAPRTVATGGDAIDAALVALRGADSRVVEAPLRPRAVAVATACRWRRTR